MGNSKAARMSPDYSILTQFRQLNFYTHHFTDSGLWEPFVREVCVRHQMGCTTVQEGLPGTNPTFIVDQRWVVKFYGVLFEGMQSFEIEKQVNQFISAQRVFPAPALTAAGMLCEENPDWPWPYLVFEYVPGVSIGEVYAQVSRADKLGLARELGGLVRSLHEMLLPGKDLLAPSWENYLSFLAAQRHDCVARHTGWGVLPPKLLAQIDAYLPPVESLVNLQARPILTHADLTRDHILGDMMDGRWQTRAIIDFGDARVADIGWELIALYVDLFDLDKILLREFLTTYGESGILRDPAACRKAMAYTLLFPFEITSMIFRKLPSAANAASLEEFACLLWNIE